MPHFEVHTLADDRWLIDGIFFDKQTAIDDARLLLERTRLLDAVRVLQVEEVDSGFYEWTVYVALQPRPRRRRRRPPPPAAAPVVPSPRAAAPARPPAPARMPANGAPALLLLGVLALCGFLILFAHRPKQPEWVWVFDRPEAWQPHALRNPWTGEVSR